MNHAQYRVTLEYPNGPEFDVLVEASGRDEAMDIAEDDNQGATALDAEFIENIDDDEPGDNMTDAEADADVLASCGWGTDEDYGGGCEHL